VPSLNLQPHNSWWISTETNEFTSYRKFVGAIQKKENQKGHKIQNQSACVEYSSWSFKKTEE